MLKPILSYHGSVDPRALISTGETCAAPDLVSYLVFFFSASSQFCRAKTFPHPCFLTHVRSFFSLAVLLHSRDGKPIDLKVRSILLASRKPSLPPTSPFLLRTAMFISDSSTPSPTVALTELIRITDGAYVHVDYAFPNLLLDLPSSPGQMPSQMGFLPLDLVRVGDVHRETMVEAVDAGASPLPSFHGRFS